MTPEETSDEVRLWTISGPIKNLYHGGSTVPEAGWQAGAVIGRDLLEVDLRRKEKGFHFDFWQSLRGISEHCFERHFLIEHFKLFSRCINFKNSIGHSF